MSNTGPVTVPDEAPSLYAENIRLNRRVRELEKWLRHALEAGAGTQYWGDEDECGTHVCCGVVSYKEHDPDCWTVKARDILNTNPERTE